MEIAFEFITRHRNIEMKNMEDERDKINKRNKLKVQEQKNVMCNRLMRQPLVGLNGQSIDL